MSSGHKNSDWADLTLGEIAVFVNGFGFSQDQWQAVGYPIVRIENMRDPTAETNFFAGSLPDRYLVDSGDILLSWSATLMALIWNRGPAWVNQHIFKVLPRRGTEPGFLYHLLSHILIDLSAQSHGTTMRHIKRSDLLPFRVQIPPSAEQQRIAEILDTADDAIRSRERLIAKLEQAKHGLLHDLLTNGIGDRFPGWRWLPLSSCVSAPITYGIVQAGPHIEGGVPYIRTGDMSGEHLDREGLLCTSQQIASSYARSTVRTGEIVCAIRATVGKVLLVPEELDGANLTQGTARISPAAHIDPIYLLWALRGESAQRQFGLAIKGTTFSEITLAQLREIEVPVPGTIAEQRHIATRMSSVDGQIAREASCFSKLRLLKHGLMDDLLTGRVRVGSQR